MSDSKAYPGFGLGDTAFDPDILTKEIDHDFFDDPPLRLASGGVEKSTSGLHGSKVETPTSPNGIDYAKCQVVANDMPKKEPSNTLTTTQSEETVESSMGATAAGASMQFLSSSKSENDVRLDKSIRSKHYEGEAEPGQKDQGDSDNEGEVSWSSSNMTVHLEMGKDLEFPSATDFYSIKSNATSPTYPRPKQCYQLQQRRRSVGSLKKGGGMQSRNTTDAELSPTTLDNGYGTTDNFDGLSSSSSSSDSLSDSTESELESLDSDDEEFVDMLGKYFDYIEQDSDCSDLTEVSPMSSLAASPLPSSFLTESDTTDLNLETEDTLCSAADGLQIHHPEDLAIRSQLLERKLQARLSNTEKQLTGMKPKLPLIISTTETVIIPEIQNPEEKFRYGDDANGDSQSEDKDLCFGCCLETAKKVLSRENSPSRNGNMGLLQTAEEEDRSLSCCSANSSVSIPRGDSTRSSSSAWSTVNNGSRKSRQSSSGSGSSPSMGGKRAARNYTFTPDQMKKIERENHILLRKILDTHKGHHHHARTCNRNSHHRIISASTTLARLRQQKRIEDENNMLMKRLQTVKPSKDIGDAFKPVKN